ncbi:stage II sporulation protein M [Flavobacterium taihuense]|uniref:Stage II sporulation protein M n=1 Tax=Flavobacterium taihuense TaxID=2857508 RepID=A0ABS6XWG0_9FLAO|nr:stage II sporulation protein M [Flavobacterium taihuense]MBW4360198.1 stage II sporulation protein M [Flavobacterium taihuense]
MKVSICLFAWLLGVFIAFNMYHSFMKASENQQIISNNHKKNKVFANINKSAEYPYFSRVSDLFIHNLCVAFLLSIGGLFTAGSLSIIVLVYNGFLATSTILYVSNYQKLTFILSRLWHAPFEIVALIWFASIGLSGATLFSRFLKKEKILFYDLYLFKSVWKPMILLFIAALIEAI